MKSNQPRNELGKFVEYENFQWYQKSDKPVRIGVLDIEGSGLTGNMNFVVSWAIKERGTNRIVSDILTEQDRKKDTKWRTWDKRIIESCINEMRKYDVLVGYYSSMYDFPMLRTRAMYHKLNFPKYNELRQIDLYFSVRSKMALNRNSLKMATKHLGISGKTDLGDYWMDAVFGDKDALKEMLHHNLEDVKITDKLMTALEPYVKFTKKPL